MFPTHWSRPSVAGTNPGPRYRAKEKAGQVTNATRPTTHQPACVDHCAGTYTS